MQGFFKNSAWLGEGCWVLRAYGALPFLGADTAIMQAMSRGEPHPTLQSQGCPPAPQTRGPGIQTGMKPALMSTSPQRWKEPGMVSSFQDSLGIGWCQRWVSIWKIPRWVLKGTLVLLLGLPNRLRLQAQSKGFFIFSSHPSSWNGLKFITTLSHRGIWYTAPDIQNRGAQAGNRKNKNYNSSLLREIKTYIINKIRMACYKIVTSKEQERFLRIKKVTAERKLNRKTRWSWGHFQERIKRK